MSHRHPSCHDRGRNCSGSHHGTLCNGKTLAKVFESLHTKTGIIINVIVRKGLIVYKLVLLEEKEAVRANNATRFGHGYHGCDRSVWVEIVIRGSRVPFHIEPYHSPILCKYKLAMWLRYAKRMWHTQIKIKRVHGKEFMKGPAILYYRIRVFRYEALLGPRDSRNLLLHITESVIRRKFNLFLTLIRLYVEYKLLAVRFSTCGIAASEPQDYK